MKAQNPGVDLLTTVDWDAVIVPQVKQDTTAPTLTGLGGFAESETSTDNPNDNSEPGIEVAATDSVTSTMSDKTGLLPSKSDASPDAADPSSTVTVETRTRSLNVGTLAFAVFGGLAVLVAGLSLLIGRRGV